MSNDDKAAPIEGQVESAAGEDSAAPQTRAAEFAEPVSSASGAAATEAEADGGSAESMAEPALEAGGFRDGISRGLAALALLIALAAAAGSGFLFWQYRQFYVALDTADEGAQNDLERVRADLRGFRDQLDAIVAEQQAAQRQLAAQRAEVESLPPRFVELEERLVALQGVSADVRRRWLRAEAQYLLGVANVELTLGGHFENAIAALEMADAKLRELGNPGFTPVRETISDELQRLRAVPLPDVEGLSLTIGNLARRVDALPLTAGLPERYERAVVEPDELEPGLARAWASLKSALKGMISIEQTGANVSRALSGEDGRMVRRNLELQLASARLGLLREQSEAYRQGLSTARDLLQRYFDRSDGQVISALALLDELLTVDVRPPRPDISGSQNMLRQLASLEDAAR
jgi:uroporphyrin-3 C-methyltransferase